METKKIIQLEFNLFSKSLYENYKYQEKDIFLTDRWGRW